jgi:hypothetical protein
MGSEVVHLPDTMHRQWRVYEARLQELMQENGIDAEIAKIALARIKPIYLRCVTPLPLSDVSDAEAVLKQINSWVSQLGTGLLLEIILREAELIRLRREGG